MASIFHMWREARGNRMRQELVDIIKRVDPKNAHVQFAFFNNIVQTIESLKDAYDSASTSERKTILRECKKSAHEMWDRGDWPSSLGLAISCLNIESKYLPGEDAAYVNQQTNKIIQDAIAFFERKES